jgi:hypothetical protein
LFAASAPYHDTFTDTSSLLLYPLNRARRIDYEVFQDAASLRVAAR